MCTFVLNEIIDNAEAPHEIVEAVLKLFRLAVFSAFYGNFLSLLLIRSGQNESFKNFASQFEAQLELFNGKLDTTELPVCLLAFMLLENFNLEANLRVLVLACSAPRPDHGISNRDTECYLNKTFYFSVAAVVRHCDNFRLANFHESHSYNSSFSSNNPTINKKNKNLSPEQFVALKYRSKCRTCG